MYKRHFFGQKMFIQDMVHEHLHIEGIWKVFKEIFFHPFLGTVPQVKNFFSPIFIKKDEN